MNSKQFKRIPFRDEWTPPTSFIIPENDNMLLPSIDWLKYHCQKIHYFGLGFIQIKISPSERFHFYIDLGKTVKEEEIHNHRYDFVSRILKGNFSQTFWEVTEGDTHWMKQESCKENDDTHYEPSSVAIRSFHFQEYKAGDSYFMDNHTFHTVENTANAITHLTRTDYKSDLATVIYPKERNITCPFSLNRPEEELWEIVKYLCTK